MPELTDVEFQFYTPDGTPLADTMFSITLRRSGFVTEAVGVVVPDVINAITGVDGKVIIKLHPSSTPYFLELPSNVVVDEDCCSNSLARYKFYVPEVATGVIVRAQDLFIAVAPSNVPYDEEAILIITEAKLTSVNAARDALASAVRAETAATTIEGDADRAEAAAASADASKNAASQSATTANTAKDQALASANSADASKTAAAGSATAASQSATAASQSAAASAQSAAASLASQNAAKTSETNSKTSETNSKTNADNAAASATSALASKNAAGVSETNASTSAGTALTQANRAKTEADRAVAATDSKQDKNANLTAFSSLVGDVDRLPYFTGAGALSLAVLTSKARLLMACVTGADMRTEIAAAKSGANSDITSLSALSTALSVAQGGTGGTSQSAAQSGLGLVKVTSSTDNTAGSLLTTGWGGLGGQLQNRVYTPDQAFTTQAGGSFSYANNGGTYPAGVTDGALINMGYDTAGQFAYQLLGDWRTGNLYRRGRAAGANTAWGKIFDSINFSLDPTNGGLMSKTTINGFTVSKYANGDCFLSGPLPSTGTLAANVPTAVTADIPNVLVAADNPAIFVQLQPQIAYDHFGVVSAYIVTTSGGFITTIGYVPRNGASAQTFSPRILIKGRWI